MFYSPEDYQMLYNDREEKVDHSPGLPWLVWLLLTLAAVVIALTW